MDNTDEYLFLSKEWIGKAVAAIEEAKATDPDIKSKTAEFSLSVTYIVENLPQKLKELYGSDKVSIYVELDQGTLRHFTVGKEVLSEKDVDFTVTSEYEIAKKNFQGELNLVSTFIKRRIKVSPWRKIYLDPAFSAKSLTTMIALIKVMRTVPTLYM